MEEVGYVVAYVDAVIQTGRHGPYASIRDVEVWDEGGASIKDEVARGRSVTFSLLPPVWSEKDFPEPGTKVVLSDFREKRKGWKAFSARYFRPADKQPAKGRKRAQSG